MKNCKILAKKTKGKWTKKRTKRREGGDKGIRPRRLWGISGIERWINVNR
jgi:hypothetical protein